jgi:hypothetical protein
MAFQLDHGINNRDRRKRSFLLEQTSNMLLKSFYDNSVPLFSRSRSQGLSPASFARIVKELLYLERLGAGRSPSYSASWHGVSHVSTMRSECTIAQQPLPRRANARYLVESCVNVWRFS